MNPRLLTAILFLASSFTIATATRAEESAAPILGSTVFAFDKLEAKPTGVGLFRRVADQPTATLDRFECHVTTLNPGNLSHPPHQHAQEELIILRDGTLDVFINGATARAEAGDVFFFASNDHHNVKNVGSTPATYWVFNVRTEATKHVPTTPAAESAPASALKSGVFHWAKFPVKPTKSGERREIVDSPTVTCTHLEAHATTLRPGEVPHAPHHHPDEEIVLVKEGTMEATIKGESQRGGPGSVFFFASNDQHGMKNVGDTTATYYVMRIVTAATPPAGGK